MSDLACTADEWWEVTHENSVNNLDRIFSTHAELRRAVRQAMIGILLSVTFVYTYSLEIGSASEKQSSAGLVDTRLISKAKKLIFHAHQNFLALIELIISRLPRISCSNLWAHSLQAILLNKQSS